MFLCCCFLLLIDKRIVSLKIIVIDTIYVSMLRIDPVFFLYKRGKKKRDYPKIKSFSLFVSLFFLISCINIMDSHSMAHIKATIIIKFAYYDPMPINSNLSMSSSSLMIDHDQGVTETETVNAAKSCAVCGSRLHMTSEFLKGE